VWTWAVCRGGSARLAASDWSAKHSIGPVNVRLLQLGRSLLWSLFCCPLMVGAVCCVCVVYLVPSLSLCVCAGTSGSFPFPFGLFRNRGGR
jgi:hypothetical protein